MNLSLNNFPVPDWYKGYVSVIGERNPLDVLKTNLIETTAFFSSIPPDKHDFAYQPDKWTIKEVVLHVIDSERIFACRALRFARNDKTPLPGFDENFYVPNSGAGSRTMESLIKEFQAVRNATIELFNNLNEEMWRRSGVANDKEFNVILSAIIIAGHELHHLKVLRERYLQ